MIAKTKEDIAILREGGRRLANHVRTLIALIQVGVPVQFLEDEAKRLVSEGGDKLAFINYPSGKRQQKFPGGLIISINDCIVHGPAQGSKDHIADGDIVTVDFGIQHEGLFTDHAQTVIAGIPRNVREEELVRVTYEATERAIAAAQWKHKTGDIGHVVETIAKAHNFGYPKVLAGHGVGRSVHEDPYVPNFGTPHTGTELVEGLVIAIEPMFTLGSGDVYIDNDNFSYKTKDGSRAAHVEHTILITKNGPEILTR